MKRNTYPSYCGKILGLGLRCGFVATSLLPSVSQAAEPEQLEISTASPTAQPSASGDADADPIPTPDYAGARAVRPDNEIRDRFRRTGYMDRFKPEAGLVEIGMYTGFFMTSKDHDLRVEELPRDEYYWIAGSIGGRFAYFPLAYLGAEIEGFGAGGRVKESGYSAIFYTVRGHVVAQLPFWSVTPFVLVGGGALGAANEIMGHDRDPALHFGMGVKIPTSQRVSSRIDIRDTLAHKFGGSSGALTHYPEGHIGVHFTLNRTIPDPPRDQDYDGLADTIDECPRQGALTVNGCPAPLDEASGADDDADGDGVKAGEDKCPDQAGPAPSGCATQDLDEDGAPDLTDGCPSHPETKNGFEDGDGCPDALPSDLQKAAGPIPGVKFKGTKLEEASRIVLAERLVIVAKYPQVKFEILVHSEGGSEGEALAQKRAATIVEYFVEKGAAQEQVRSGAGGGAAPGAPAKPTGPADASTAQVELRVVVE